MKSIFVWTLDDIIGLIVLAVFLIVIGGGLAYMYIEEWIRRWRLRR